jgi:hypothetical protein
VRVRPLRDRSRATLVVAGATTLAGKLGAIWEECRPSAEGALGTPGCTATDRKARRLATAPVEAGSLRLGASTTFWASEEPRATLMV